MTPAPNATRAAGELLPCPFCGVVPAVEPRIGYNDGGDSDRSTYCVVCWPCSIDGPSAPSEADAIASWNRRAPLAPAVVDAGTLAADLRIAVVLYGDLRAKYAVTKSGPGSEAIGKQIDSKWGEVLATCDALATAAPLARAVPDRGAVEGRADELSSYAWNEGFEVGSGAMAQNIAGWTKYRADARERLLALIYGDAPADASEAAS